VACYVGCAITHMALTKCASLNIISNILAHSKACYRPLIGSMTYVWGKKFCGFYHPFSMVKKSRWDWDITIIVLTSNVILCHTSECKSLSLKGKASFFLIFKNKLTAFFCILKACMYSEGKLDWKVISWNDATLATTTIINIIIIIIIIIITIIVQAEQTNTGRSRHKK